MAKTGASDPSFRRSFDNLRQSEICVGGLGAMLGRNGETDRPFVDNRRQNAARTAVETFPAENDLHANRPRSST